MMLMLRPLRPSAFTGLVCCLDRRWKRRGLGRDRECTTAPRVASSSILPPSSRSPAGLIHRVLVVTPSKKYRQDTYKDTSSARAAYSSGPARSLLAATQSPPGPGIFSRRWWTSRGTTMTGLPGTTLMGRPVAPKSRQLTKRRSVANPITPGDPPR